MYTANGVITNQAINSLLCKRCYNALFSCMPYSHLKSLLKERSGTMGDEGDLFDKEFRNFVTVNRKANCQTVTSLKPVNQMKKKAQNSQRNNYQGNISRIAYSFGRQTQNSIHRSHTSYLFLWLTM